MLEGCPGSQKGTGMRVTTGRWGNAWSSNGYLFGSEKQGYDLSLHGTVLAKPIPLNIQYFFLSLWVVFLPSFWLIPFSLLTCPGHFPWSVLSPPPPPKASWPPHKYPSLISLHQQTHAHMLSPSACSSTHLLWSWESNITLLSPWEEMNNNKKRLPFSQKKRGMVGPVYEEHPNQSSL